MIIQGNTVVIYTLVYNYTRKHCCDIHFRL